MTQFDSTTGGPILPPRKPVELPPIDRSPVDDVSNAAYAALTPGIAEGTAEPVETAARATPSTRSLLETSETATVDPAEPPPRPTQVPALARLAAVLSVIASAAGAAVALGFMRWGGDTPAEPWPLFVGAAVGAVAALLAFIARRTRAWVWCLALAGLVAVACIVTSFIVG